MSECEGHCSLARAPVSPEKPRAIEPGCVRGVSMRSSAWEG